MSSIASAPMIGVDLKRSAERLIVEFGETAWVKAEECAHALRPEGFEFTAKTCELIRGAIGEIQEGTRNR